MTSPGEVEALPTLPSFLLLPTELEVPPEGLSLPWSEQPGFTIGTMARERGSELPHRLVSSAKSWLCHTGVDRHAPILPWRGAETEDRAEPPRGVEERPAGLAGRGLGPLPRAPARGLERRPPRRRPSRSRTCYLTVPASFDAVARELTVTAAQPGGPVTR